MTSREATFGARFLEEWTRLGGPLSNWNYAAIQDIRASDQEGMAAALRRHEPLTTHAAVQRIRRARSPEDLARDLHREALAAGQMNLWLLFALWT